LPTTSAGLREVKAVTGLTVESISEMGLEFEDRACKGTEESKDWCLEVRLVNWKITETGPDLTATLT
jgi:hypothetical protein